jgi:Zn-dependent protease with chaperone function
MMNPFDFIHPDDASALQALKNIPIFPAVMEKVFQYGLDEIRWSENVSTNVRLSEKQLPDIYNHLPPICKKLGIPVPELYLQMSPIPNAWTSGNSRIYIVVTLGLVRRFKDEELDAVLAHECGHILCHHVLYSMVADSLYNIGDAFVESMVGQIGAVAMKPLKQALMTWSRASELTADRVACLITSAPTMTKVLARLEGIPRVILDDMDFDVWASQGSDYESLKNGNTWNKIIRYMSNMGLDHPYGPVRAFEVKQWERTSQYLRLKEGLKLIESGRRCPHCGNYIDEHWGFCKNCGNKLIKK